MIKKISEDEFENLALRGRGPATMPYNHIHGLRAGERLIIEATDWHRKDSPGKMCRYIEKKNPGVKYQVFTLLDKKGWAVQRIK